MAMAHSVEGRYPFLDYCVVEFGAKLPLAENEGTQSKVPAEASQRGLVPESILRRSKQSYRAPDGKGFFDETSPDYVRRLEPASAFTTYYQQKLGGIYANQTTEIEQEIRSFLTEKFLFGRSEALNDDVPLLGNVIDSQGVIELIVFVQERFTIAVDDEEVTTDNFASVKSAVAFIEKKLRSKG
jgi:acyl carrier protein